MNPGLFNASTFRRMPESPVLVDGFLGMEIAVKASLLELEQSDIMIFGTYRFKAEFCNRFESLSYEMAIVCIDAASHIPVIRNLRNAGFDMPKFKSKYDETDPGFDETIETSWFNTRLSLSMNSPRPEAGYHIFAIIGDQKSNVLRLRRKGK